MTMHSIYDNVNPIRLNQIRKEVNIPEGLELEDILCLTNQEWYEYAIPDQMMSKCSFDRLRNALQMARHHGSRTKKEKERALLVMEFIEQGTFDISEFTAKLIMFLVEHVR